MSSVSPGGPQPTGENRHKSKKKKKKSQGIYKAYKDY